VLEAVGPSLVENVWVPESRVLPMRREWDKASSPDMKGFGSGGQKPSGGGI
jgi:hypothetical protein